MISYIGGKSNISKFVIPHIPKDIETYVEGFSGMFWVFFKMDISDYPNLKTIVYNDYNGLNSNLFKCVKHYDVLLEELSKYQVQQIGVSETPKEYGDMFREFQKEIFNDNLVIPIEPDFELAAKYVFVLTQIFSGSKPSTATYMDYKGKYKSKYLTFMDKLRNPKYIEHFERITFVENMDFQEVIEKYDSPTTYYYLDPPYWKTENFYSNHEFNKDTHERLAICIKKMKGRFSLSYYDFPQLSEWFPKDEYRWDSQNFKKAAGAKKGKEQSDATELLIMNY